MKVAKWGNSLAIRIPKDLVEELALKEDDVIVTKGQRRPRAGEGRRAREGAKAHQSPAVETAARL